TSVLHPEVSVAAEFEGGVALRLERRLRAFTKDALSTLLADLAEPSSASAPERGLLYQLRSGLGVCTRRAVDTQLRALSPAERARLQQRRVHVGRRFVYCPDLVHGDAMRLRAALLGVYHGRNFGPLAEGPRSKDAAGAAYGADLSALGYERAGTTLLRCDAFEAALTARQQGHDSRALAA